MPFINLQSTIRLAGCESWQVWESDLHQFEYSIFQSPEWILAITKKGKQKPVFFDFYRDGQKIGKISGIETFSLISGKQLFFFSGPALKSHDENIYQSIIKSLKRYAIINRNSRIIICSYGSRYSPSIDLNSFYESRRNEYVLKLDPHFTSRYSRNFKRNLKKSEPIAPDIVLSSADISQIQKLLYSTYESRRERCRKKYKLLALPFLDFDALDTLIKISLAQVYSAVSRGEIIGVLVTLESKNLASALLIGVEKQHYDNGISAFLYHHVFSTLLVKFFQEINLGGTLSEKDGCFLTQFKKSMGADEITKYDATTNFLYYPYKLFNPLLLFGRKLPQHNLFVQLLKRILSNME